MTKTEATKVVKILLKADGGCPVCTKDLLQRFIKDFPEYKILAENLWVTEGQFSLEELTKDD